MRKLFARTIMLAVALSSSFTAIDAQIPNGYYASLKGKKGAEVKDAVYNVIKSANVLSYGSGSGHTWEGFYTTDRTDDNMVIDRYSYGEFYFGTIGSSVSGMNIEHSFPKSWWGGSQNQAYKDLFNLMPSESTINTKKSNYPMGEVTSDDTGNGCTKVGNGNNGYKLWEPADQWKGDFARGYMYMATAYQDFTWSGTQALQILQQGNYPTLQEWAYTLYLKWARTDKVDEVEIKRNDDVCSIQGNRNPYVDFPNLMEYIWGDSIDYAFDPDKTLCTAGSTGGGGGGEVDDPDPQPSETIVYEALFTSSDGDCTIQNISVPYDGFELWVLNTKYGWVGNAFKDSQSNAAESILITPEIDLTAYNKARLSFEHAVNYMTNPQEMLSVDIIREDGSVELDGIEWPAGNSWTFNSSGDIDISAYAGGKIKVGFHYRSTNEVTPAWEIKTLVVTGINDPTGIKSLSAGTAKPDLTRPYDVFDTAGRSLRSISGKGIFIIRQDGNTWKVKR
ncbi:MAG: endonuclease [Prevotella sp.]